jgi:hypothetical protein
MRARAWLNPVSAKRKHEEKQFSQTSIFFLEIKVGMRSCFIDDIYMRREGMVNQNERPSQSWRERHSSQRIIRRIVRLNAIGPEL